ncbi:MAG: 2-hydroxychromene-2-carboxylate isomerase [Myxococcales bacterium]|nr:2-hydroxychromene-2-carboxylate isomerase [Myxococcales bacterium]
MSETKTLEYFYDFSSPYAYLAHEEAAKVAADHDATLIYRPFFLGGLFKELGSALVPINDASPQKRAWLNKDISRWAEMRDLPYAWPEKFPMNTITALRVVLQLLGPAHADAHQRACSAIFRGYWADGKDISDPAVLFELLTAAGLDAQTLLENTRDPGVKARLFEATGEALKRGAIGAPTFFVGDLAFWGQDRFAMVEAALDGWQPKAG